MSQLIASNTPTNTNLNDKSTKNDLNRLNLPQAQNNVGVKGGLTEREAQLDKWTSDFCGFIQKQAKGSKPVLVVFCENHTNPTELATQIQMVSNLSTGFFGSNGVNYYVEVSEGNLEKFRQRSLSERNTSIGSIVIPIADALNFNLIAADPYNTGQYSDAQMMGELFNRRDEAIINKVAEGNKNAILSVGATHAKAIISDSVLNQKYTVIPVFLSPKLDRSLQANPQVQSACDWYNNPPQGGLEENRMPQGAYSKPEPWKMIQRMFSPEEQIRIGFKLDPHCRNVEQLKRNLENYDSSLHQTFGNIYNK